MQLAEFFYCLRNTRKPVTYTRVLCASFSSACWQKYLYESKALSSSCYKLITWWLLAVYVRFHAFTD